MSSGSSEQPLYLTAWSDLAHNLADLLLLGLGEAICNKLVATHSQCLEFSLPGEDGKQGTQALIGTFKPIPLTPDGEALQGVELSVGECLEELCAI